MADLVNLGGRQFETRRGDARSVSELDEGRQLVEREEVPDAIGERLGDVAAIVGERVGGVTRLPAPVLVLQRLRQVPVIECVSRLVCRRISSRASRPRKPFPG
jgi:hypothetical protein